MSVIVYRRVATGPGAPSEPGTYVRWLANEAGFLAVLVCENGHGLTLRAMGRFGGNHQVAEDGTVSPSVVCLAPGCTSHHWAVLGDWGAPAAPSPKTYGVSNEDPSASNKDPAS